jgi:tungstate transport system substrate-binding protein
MPVKSMYNNRAKPYVLISCILFVILMLAMSFNIIDGDRYGMGGGKRLVISTTTSLYDTGLWDVIEEKFETAFDMQVDIISGGTGRAFELGKRGDVDVVVVHDVDREMAFIEKGYGSNRQEFAFNYFVLIGPSSDPASIYNLGIQDAFQKIMEYGKIAGNDVTFVSRGDESGTHSREKKIWRSIEIEEIGSDRGSWYVEAGAGMGTTLMLANEKSSYTLTDMGTFLAFQEEIDLISLVDTGEYLLNNTYSVISVNPDFNPEINSDGAGKFIKFLLSDEIQYEISVFGLHEHKISLFHAISEKSD